MTKPVLFAVLISATLFCSFDGLAKADSILTDIRSSKDCGPFLKITSKQTQEGLTAYVVRIQPEEATNAGDLYRGRVTTGGHLKISSADAILAAMQIHKSSDKSSDRDMAEFRFELAPQLAKHSVFMINASFVEKDGTPTIGGGGTFRIHLDGFLPGSPPR